MDTSGYGGRKLHKNATIYTNDPETPTLGLTIFGTVEKFVTLIPSALQLVGPASKEITGSVRIVPEKKYPFKLIETNHMSLKNIRYTFEKVSTETGEEYLLTVSNLKRKKGRYYETIHLKTDNQAHAEIKIRVYGNIF